MEGVLIRLITALLGTVGFALLFRVSKRNLPFAALGGLLTYLVYESIMLIDGGALVAAFAAALFMSLYSETLARLLRAPAPVFLLPCAIPIVPGGALYHTIYNLLNYNESVFLENATATVSVALGIAIGMSVSSILVGVALQLQKREFFSRKKQ